jgi:plasmid stability protein
MGSALVRAAARPGATIFSLHFTFNTGIVVTISIRGLDDEVLAKLKQRAQREGCSLNNLVVRLLRADVGVAQGAHASQRFDDLDALAGTWSTRQAEAFTRDTAPFAGVDPALWTLRSRLRGS